VGIAVGPVRHLSGVFFFNLFVLLFCVVLIHLDSGAVFYYCSFALCWNVLPL
jgi:hypothetical protein